MSFDLADIRATLELPDTGLNVYPAIAGDNTLPFAVLGNVEAIEYTKTYGGHAQARVPLWVFVDRADDAAAQRALDRATAIGKPGSVYTALRTLADMTGKPWRSITIGGTGPYGTADFGQAKCLAVAFNLTITA